MRFATRCLALALSVLPLLPAAARVYDVQVGANNDNLYAPASLTIDPGDQVRFVYVSGIHPTVSDSPTPLWPAFTLTNSNLTYTTPPLTQAGTFPYHCSAHAFQLPNGTWQGMVGTIRVNPTPLAAAPPVLATGPVLSFFPNPARGQLTVQLATAAAGYSYRLRLSNVLGREVRTLTLPASVAAVGSVPLDLGGLPAGLYFCALLVNDRVVSVSRLTVL